MSRHLSMHCDSSMFLPQMCCRRCERFGRRHGKPEQQGVHAVPAVGHTICSQVCISSASQQGHQYGTCQTRIHILPFNNTERFCQYDMNTTLAFMSHGYYTQLLAISDVMPSNSAICLNYYQLFSVSATFSRDARTRLAVHQQYWKMTYEFYTTCSILMPACMEWQLLWLTSCPQGHVKVLSLENKIPDIYAKCCAAELDLWLRLVMRIACGLAAEDVAAAQAIWPWFDLTDITCWLAFCSAIRSAVWLPWYSLNHCLCIICHCYVAISLSTLSSFPFSLSLQILPTNTCQAMKCGILDQLSQG